MRAGLLAVFLASTAGYAGAAPSLPADHLPVPLMRQAHPYSCGAAALQSVLAYWGVYDGGEAGLYGPLHTTPKDGTDPRSLTDYARSLKLTAAWRENNTQADLRAALRKGVTVILDIQAWRDGATAATPWADDWEDGHYVVLIGMDENYLYLMDPSVSGAYSSMPLTELDARWHDYEDRTGKVWRNSHLAIFISGKKPLPSYPGPLQRTE